MSTLIITPQSPYPPMGALYVSDALIKAGQPHVIADCTVASDVIDKMSFSQIFMSVMTSPQIKDFVRLSKHTQPRSNVYWGGAHPTLNREQCDNEWYIDKAIAGPVENWMGARSKPLDAYSPNWDAAGDIERFVFPESHSVRGPETTEHRVFYYLSTSRGCPYSCSFCAVPTMSGGKWRAHSAEWVIGQVDYIMANTTANAVGFWDDNFWVDRQRADRIIDYLAGKGIGYLVEARADLLLRENAALMKRLKQTGCLQVFVGAESGNDETLESIGKGTSAVDYYKLAAMAKQMKMPVRFSLIVGFVNESDNGVNDTLDLAATLEAAEYCNVSGPKLYTPYPGTVEYDRAVQAGFCPPESTLEWSRIHRKTEDCENAFPWLCRNLAGCTIQRIKEVVY